MIHLDPRAQSGCTLRFPAAYSSTTEGAADDGLREKRPARRESPRLKWKHGLFLRAAKRLRR